MYYCDQCGNALGDSARFCSACGAPRQTVAEAAVPTPGRQIDQGAGVPTRAQSVALAPNPPRRASRQNLWILVGIAVFVVVGILAAIGVLSDDPYASNKAASEHAERACFQAIDGWITAVYTGDAQFTNPTTTYQGDRRWTVVGNASIVTAAGSYRRTDSYQYTCNSVLLDPTSTNRWQVAYTTCDTLCLSGPRRTITLTSTTT